MNTRGGISQCDSCFFTCTPSLQMSWNAGLNSAVAKHRRATHVVFHCYVLSGKAQVGFCDSRLDDHFLQELGVHLPVRDARQKARTYLTVVHFNRPLLLGLMANKWGQTRLPSQDKILQRASWQHEERLLISNGSVCVHSPLLFEERLPQCLIER